MAKMAKDEKLTVGRLACVLVDVLDSGLVEPESPVCVRIGNKWSGKWESFPAKLAYDDEDDTKPLIIYVKE